MLKEIENAFAQLIDVGSTSLIQKGRLKSKLKNNKQCDERNVCSKYTKIHQSSGK